MALMMATIDAMNDVLYASISAGIDAAELIVMIDASQGTLTMAAVSQTVMPLGHSASSGGMHQVALPCSSEQRPAVTALAPFR